LKPSFALPNCFATPFPTFSALDDPVPKTDLVICPPAIFISSLADAYKKVKFGVQDISNYSVGEHTGYITTEMCESLGIKYSIVGHSERREAGETDSLINSKIKNAIKKGMTVILCVGEKDRYEHGNYLRHIAEQLSTCLDGIKKDKAKNHGAFCTVSPPLRHYSVANRFPRHESYLYPTLWSLRTRPM
jgi:triosephosphate isomerase